MDMIMDIRFVQAIAATIVIGVVPAVLLVFISIDSNRKNRRSMQVLPVTTLQNLLAFASGGLLGDVFMHLIPETFSIAQATGKNMSYVILFGVYAFFTLERFINILLNRCSENKVIPVESSVDTGPESTTVRQRNGFSDPSDDHPPDKVQTMTAKGYLSLIGDFTHNITDGLIIGSSFMHSTSFGITTSISIMCHEIPNEIGDFVNLINSNCSKKNAILLQFLTAIGSLVGTVLAFVIGSMSSAIGDALIPFTTGGFLYIGMVSMLGQLSCDDEVEGGTWHLIEMIISASLGIAFLTLASQI